MSDGASVRRGLPVDGEVEELQLAVGIGNSTIRAAVMAGTEVRARVVFGHAALEDATAAEQLRGVLDRAGCAREARSLRAGICSVVPSLTARCIAQLAELGVSDVHECHAREGTWFPTRYRTMKTLGVDRYCVVLAARELYGFPVLVIDCGTATTVNVVDAAGVFLGGAIAPGVETAFRALYEGTAQLPAMDAGIAPLIGADTAESIRSGVLHLARCGLAGMVAEIRERLGSEAPVILTGGNARHLLAVGLDVPGLHEDHDILLRGIIFHLHHTT